MDNLHDDKNIETSNADNSQPVTDQDKLERYKQQMEGSKQEAQKFRDLAIDSEVKRAEVDANSIVELHDKDPKMADEVAKKFWYDGYKEVKASLSNDKDPSDSLSEKDKFNQWYEERRVKEESGNAHSQANKILDSLEWDIKTEAKRYYDMITDGKSLNVDQATEFAKMATLYVNKDNLKSDKMQEWLINFGSTGLWTSSPASSKKADTKNQEFWTQAFWGKFAHLYNKS